MNPSEQAGAAPAPDSRPMNERVAALFSTDAPVKTPAKAKAAPQAPQAEPEHGDQEQTDQAPNPEDAASESEPDSTAPQFEEVEYDGELYQVPPKLKEAIIRQSDYTKKTQEVAEQRKLVEHQQAQMRAAQLNMEFQNAIQPQMQELARIEHQLAQYDHVNWREISQEDRTTAILEMQRLERLQTTKKQEIEGKRAEHSQKFNEQLAKLQTEANEVLKSRIPGWSNDTAKAVSEWALSNGFTQDEISSIHDPRHAEVLWKASQYDKARSSAKPVVQQAKAAKPTSSNPMPQQVKEKLAFRKEVAKHAPGTPAHQAAVKDRIAKLFR